MDLNEKQLQALDLDRHISLTAGAGTGKTRVLVERYLRALREGRAGISGILALTFTEKAAAEMKIRLRRSFAEIIAAARPGDEARAWEEQLEQFRNPCISTFHSLCSSLLREFPIEAGVDPSFEVLDEAGAALLRAECLDTFIERKDRAADPDLAALSRLWNRRQVANTLQSLLGRRHAALSWAARAGAMSPEQMEAHIQTLAREFADGMGTAGRCRDLLQRLEAFHCSDPTDKLYGTAEAVRAALEDTAHGGSLDLEPLLAVNLQIGSSKKWDDIKGVKAVLGECRDLARELAAFQFTAKDRIAARAAISLARLFTGYMEEYARRKGAGALLDFDDLEQCALDLLEGNEAIRRALRDRFRYILIDEFQDTNDIQWRILRLLAADESSGSLSSNTFVVGDEKQSIYAFRGANVAVFDRARTDIVQSNRGGGRIEMDICYRSREGLIRFFNTIFPHVFAAAPDDGGETQIEYFPIECRREDHGGDAAVEFLVSEDPAQEESEGEPVDDAAAVARRIRMLAREGYAYRDIAVLFAARTKLDDYKEALRDEGVPFRTVGGFGFFECREVLDLLGIVNFLAHPGDNLNLLTALRSLPVGLSDEDLLALSHEPGSCLWRRLEGAAGNPALPGAERIAAAHALLHRWLGAAGRAPLGDLLRGICRDTGLAGALAATEHPAQARLNVEKLISMARDYESREDAGVHGFAAWLETQIASGVREPEAAVAADGQDAVQLMTIHASKGLEFRAVIIPQTGGKTRQGASESLLLGETRPGVFEAGFTVPDPDADFESNSSAIRNMIKSVLRRRERDEFKRLLYVACTRARDKLVLAGVRRAALDAMGAPNGKAPARWDEITAAALAAAGMPDPEAAGVAVFSQNDLEAGRTERPEQTPLHAQRKTRALLDRKPATGTSERLRWLAPLERDALEPMPFSVREIVSFAQSPDEYLRSHVLGVPPDWDFGAPAGAGAGMSPLTRGSVVHKAFELLPQIPPGKEWEAIETILTNHGVHDPEARRAFTDHYAPLVSRFRATPEGRAAAGPDALREMPFMIRIGRWRVRGVIDALFLDGASCRIVDYKTDRISKNQVLDKTMSYRLQLELYALAALQSAPGAERVLASLYFVEPDAFGAEVLVERGDAPEIMGRVAAMLEEMHALHLACEQGGRSPGAAERRENA